MKIRLFGANDCDKCLLVKAALDEHRFVYDFVDATRFDDEETNRLCDENNVADLPHAQLLDNAAKVVYELIGDFSPADFVERAKSLTTD